jgi:hypothetical protein
MASLRAAFETPVRQDSSIVNPCPYHTMGTKGRMPTPSRGATQRRNNRRKRVGNELGAEGISIEAYGFPLASPGS